MNSRTLQIVVYILTQWITTSEAFFRKICTSHFILRVRKGLLKVCVWEWAGDRTELQHFDPHSYGRQRCVFLVLQGCSIWGPGAHSAGFLYHILSATSLDPNSSRPQGPPPPGFLYHISSINPSELQLSDFLSWPSYIIVQRPLNRRLNLWNGMFDHHQAEITVMQFRGHSLPVYQSMSVSWDFLTLSHFVSQFPPTRFPLITAIGMCPFLPVHHLGMASLAGSKVKIQQNNLHTVVLFQIFHSNTNDSYTIIQFQVSILLW